jgi:hypothetical protein
MEHMAEQSPNRVVPPREQNLIVGIFGIGKKGVPFGCLGTHISKEPAPDK